MSKNRKNQLRLIGGVFRGRKISFPDIDTLRPTGDRIRETLFNWLSPVIVNATCLDLFAGSGALGFEAISRGARHVTMCDESLIVIKELHKNANALGFKNLEIIHGDAHECLKKLNKKFDIIFLDPPFSKNLLEKMILFLETSSLLNAKALLYLETEANLKKLPLSENWELIHSKTAGEVGYHLARWKS